MKYNSLAFTTIIAMVINLIGAGLAPLPTSAAPANAETDVSPGALPSWFTTAPATASSSHALSAASLPASHQRNPRAALLSPLPEWFSAPLRRPLQGDISLSLLTVNVTGPTVASLGSPAGAGEVYTAVIRNNSTDTAYGAYLTAAHQSYFIHDGGDSLESNIAGPIAFDPPIVSATAITWTPSITLDLSPGEVITLNFKLRATCEAKSGQQMRVGIHYNADSGQPSNKINDGGLNITTGRGNLVIWKDPAIQNLGTPDFGNPITWTVRVQNTGLGRLYDAVITDTGGISLSQPSGDLTPSASIPMLDINEVHTFTVVGVVEACNFTNVALGVWPCGNQEGDATITNPVQSTASVLFNPQTPNINVQVSSLITFSYCDPLTHTIAVTINNTGGPAANFRLDSGLENDGFLEVVPGAISDDWQYAPSTGVFSFIGGSPTGTIPGLSAGTLLTFQVRPRATAIPICAAGGGDVLFEPLYNDVCTGEPFTASPVALDYQYAEGEAPALQISKSGPDVVASGEVFTYQITVSGGNADHISGMVYVTDVLPSQFTPQEPITPSTGSSNVNGQIITWNFDPGIAATFTETLIYQVQAITTTGGICGASLIVENSAEAFALPTCPGCSALHPTADVETAIENNEGVLPGHATAGSLESCGDQGWTIANSYLITGSAVVTWTGAVFTEALGTDIGGEGALAGPVFLSYRAGSLAVVVNGTDYTGIVTPVTSTGQLVIDLSPLQAAGAPTQNLTLFITYTLNIPEDALNGAVDQTFYDWSQLFLPDFSGAGSCAGNSSFNQVLILTIGRGDLSLELAPAILDRCSANPVIITVNDNTPGRLTDHIVVTFTAVSAEIASARDFTTTGSLPDISLIGIVTDSNIGGGLGVITFTFPTNFDPDGDGEIRFEIDVNCTDEADWNAGITFQSRCAYTYDHSTTRDHVYRTPDLILFATPLEYTVREKEVLWKFFLTNNGNLTATDVLVTNIIEGLAVTDYTPDGGGISISGTLPITDPERVYFTVDEIAPNEQRAVTVTAQVIQCDPLHVTIIAEQTCFGTICSQPQAEVDFDTPDPYLLTNNGETADLPMCDPGIVVFTTKNASPDVTLYQLNITETLINLAPIPGAPMTVTIIDEHQTVIISTTAFRPISTTIWPTTTLLWRADLATPDVVTWFNALPPLHVVHIQVPVRTSCVPPNTPRSFAGASALGPCGSHLGYTEDAVTLQTLLPDMDVIKDGRAYGETSFGEPIYATPGQTVTWRIRVYNYPTDRSHVADNVVLSDTWPTNFDLVTYTTAFTPTVNHATRTITWDIGDMVPQVAPLIFLITGTVGGGDCGNPTQNDTRLTFGCDDDGCTSDVVPQDSAQLETGPDLELILYPDPLPLCEGDITVTIRNYGAAAYTNALTITLPAGYVYSETVYAGLTPSDTITTDLSAPVFKWERIPGRTSGAAPYSFDMRLRVRNNGVPGQMCPWEYSYPVTGTLSYDSHWICTYPGPQVTTATTTVDVLIPNLNVTKSPANQTANVGDVITWTITVANAGDGEAQSVVVTDVVGSGFSSWGGLPGSGGETPLVVGNVITWTLNNAIAPAGSWTAQVTAAVAGSGVHLNVVTATSVCAVGCTSATGGGSAHVALLQDFDKWPDVQTGTIGSLTVFTFATSLPSTDAIYQDLTLTDTLPAGLGYVSSWLSATYDMDGDQGGPGAVISTTPTSISGGDVIWALGDVPGAVQINGIVTAVIQDDGASYDGARLVNELHMTYTDDGQDYVYTDTADVDVLEPVLHIGKSYVTPYGCWATLLENNFNVPDIALGTVGNWTRIGGSAEVRDGMLRLYNSGDVENLTVLSDFSMSFMARKNAVTTGNNEFWLVFRSSGDYQTNTYRLEWVGGNLRLVKYVGATRTTIPGASVMEPSWLNWHHFEIRAQGSQIQVYVDGELRIDVTDASHASGDTQIRTLTGSNVELDDILVTRFGETGCIVAGDDLVTYTLTISNQAQLPGYHLVVTDDLPAWMSLLTYTMASDDPTAPAIVAGPLPGATGVLVWNMDHLTPTAPFDPLDHTAITLTVVLSVSTDVPANIVLPNRASLAYVAWPGATPVGVERGYSGGSHSTAVRTIDGEIGDYVWVDLDRDGVQNAGETPIPGVLIDLYNGRTGAYITSATTDGGGFYLFGDLPLNKTYTVQLSQTNFIPGGALYPYTATLLGGGTPATDSNANPNALFNGLGYAVTTTLTFSPIFTQDLTLDFGFYQGRIGDYVWIDHDLDGIQDAGETPVPGVIVDLFDSATGTYLSSDATDAGGLYLFDELPLNVTYTVQLSQTNFGPGGALYAYTATLYLGGAPFDNTDSNAHPNALFNGAGYAVTTTLTTLITEDLTLDFGFYRMDLGDLPEGPYPTTLARNGARHVILPDHNPTLGNTVDAELDGQPNVTATGDDVADTPDDEDGVSFSMLAPGQTAAVTVTALSAALGGADGVLNAWMDFDGDGVLESSEQIADDEALNAGDTIVVSFTVPANVTSTVYSRFRYSSDSGLLPTGPASDGEVEDYAQPIVAYDYGDLPEGPYPTTLAADGARHIIVYDGGGNPTLGRIVDAEADGQPSVGADGDDTNLSVILTYGNGAPGDDEDGVSFGPLVPGQTATVTVTALSAALGGADGILNAWMDFDGDGDLESSEQIALNEPLNAGDTIVITFPVPANVTHTVYSRFRYSTDSDLLPTGEAGDGEIEDYVRPVVAYDYGDLPEGPYPTTLAADGARHIIVYDGSGNPTLGRIVDAEADGRPGSDAMDDDATVSVILTYGDGGAGDDEDGVSFSILAPGQTAAVTVTALSAALGGANGILNAWMDFDGDGDLSDAGEQIAFNELLNEGDTIVVAFTVPAAVTDTVYSRFRYSSDSGLQPTGEASDGEVEDYVQPPIFYDYGDLPDGSVPAAPDYPTQEADDGARHIIVYDGSGNPTLGRIVDAEADGQPSSDAADDDSTLSVILTYGDGAPGDDEDGVSFSPLVPGQTAMVTVTALSAALGGADGVLNAWVDFDGNGDLAGAGEQIADDQVLNAGSVIVISFTVPANVTHTVYSRFRYSSDGGLQPTGEASDGEIEDYVQPVVAYDYGDLPQGPYPTTLMADGARHVIVYDGGGNPTLGNIVDAEADGQPDVNAMGDDSTLSAILTYGDGGAGDDEDGVSFSPLVPGQTAAVTVTALSAALGGADGVLNAWMDFDGDGDLTGAGEQIALDETLNAGDTIVISFTVPANVTHTVYSRFRYSTDSGLLPTGEAGDGEIEDYVRPVVAYDYGDLPQGPYPTTLATDGARHIIVYDGSGNPTLGRIVDAEADGQPNLNATGDDATVSVILTYGDGGAGDDEDGVSFSPLVPGQTAAVTVTALSAALGGADGVLNAWMDFDGDGDLSDAGEQIALNETLNAGDTIVISFTVPAVVTETIYGRFRYSTDSGLLPTGEASDGEIEDYVLSLIPRDYGDLPEGPYPTTLMVDGARHIIVYDGSGNPTLGRIVDAEADGQPSSDAADDDAIVSAILTYGDGGAGDDEDGVSFSPLVPGQTAMVTVTALSAALGGADGILNAWMDFNGDGDLSGAGEQIALDEVLNAGSALVISFTAPANVTHTVYSRFRYSSDGGLQPTGEASDGEIEDYVRPVVAYDYGDLPQGPYPTTLAADGARHIIVYDGSGNPTLGNIVDAEADGQPGSDALDDDNVVSVILTYGDGGAGDDEDGVSFSPLVPGQTAAVTVTALSAAHGGADGVLNAWMDFDGDGDLSGAGEQIALNEALNAGDTIVIAFTVPAVVTDTVYSRFRYSTDSGLLPTGEAGDGEIEDYVQPVVAYDFGDLPQGPYPTTLAWDGARHIILPVDNPTLGATVDAEIDGQPSSAATGDDLSGAPDDEDGVRLDSVIVPGQAATLTITGTNVSGALLSAWMDFDGDGDFADTGEQILTDVTLSAGANVLTIAVPAVVLSDTLNGRFRYSTDGGLTPTGEASDGEIEDHQFTLEMEYGDLPEGPYPTTLAADGARHILDGVTYLGSAVDVELDGQPSLDADGDDAFDGSDDEDGIVFLTPMMRGQTARIQVTAGSNGYLNAWIDFDNDGALDTVDVTDIDGTPVSLTLNDVFLTAGVHIITIRAPDVTIGSSVYSRFRFTSYDTSGALSYTGLANDGEVEDYVLMSLGNLVWLDDGAGGGAINDGALNGGEAGIADVSVELYGSGQTPGVDAPVAATTTSAGGYYTFTGLAPDVYIVHIPASEFGSGEPLEGLASSTGSGVPDADLDQDVDENGMDDAAPEINGISSGAVTLSLGDEPTSEDGDANSNLTVDFGFYPLAGLELVKTVAPASVVPNMPFTYTIRITNTGRSTLDPLALTDTLPSPDFHYVVGSGVPADPDIIAEPTLVWDNVGPLAPGESVAVTFAVTISAHISGSSFVNVASADGGTPTGVVTGTGNTTVTIGGPAVDVEKRLSGRDWDNEIFTFTISVANVGSSTLDVVPLADDYDHRYLGFMYALPYPPTEVITDAGWLSWNDLTDPSSGFGYDLLPGERYVITTVFVAVADITTTVNTAIVTGSVDVYDNPAEEDEDDEPVATIPTGLGLRYLRAAGQEDGVRVEWATWIELDTYGFWLYRATLDQFAQATQLAFQPGQGGGDGAEYAYVDKQVDREQPYWYWLVEEDNAGGRTRYGPVSATFGALGAWRRVYLPLVIKQ